MPTNTSYPVRLMAYYTDSFGNFSIFPFESPLLRPKLTNNSFENFYSELYLKFPRVPRRKHNPSQIQNRMNYIIFIPTDST